MTFRALLRHGEAALRAARIAQAASDAWVLLEHVARMDRAQYFLQSEAECPPDVEKKYLDLIQARATRVPTQYLTGTQEFLGLPFAVDARVLIPRQETEQLALEAARRVQKGDRVLDLCTGSGCVIVSLKKRKDIAAFATDISEDALAVAKQNAKDLGADVTFLRSDLFAEVPGTFDCIVSNPPYIATGEIGSLMQEVRAHEPRLALDGGADGLCFYRRIIGEAAGFLRPNGWLLLEIGHDQGADVARLLCGGGFCEVQIQKDLSGLDRVALGRKAQGGEHV